MFCILLQKARFVCLFSVFVRELTFFGQSSLLKVFLLCFVSFFFFLYRNLCVTSLLEVFLEGSDPFFKGCV